MHGAICTNPSGSFAHCCHHYFISDIFDLLDHQLTWAPGCQVGPFRSHSGWSLSLPLPPRFLQSPSFPPLFNLPCHRIPPLAQTSTMAVVSARICFPHAPPLFLLPPLSLIKVPSPKLSKGEITGCAQRCVAQHKVRWADGHNKHLRRQWRDRGREPRSSSLSKAQPRSLSVLEECLQLLLIRIPFVSASVVPPSLQGSLALSEAMSQASIVKPMPIAHASQQLSC